jgi:hypothetical protein
MRIGPLLWRLIVRVEMSGFVSRGEDDLSALRQCGSDLIFIATSY